STSAAYRGLGGVPIHAGAGGLFNAASAAVTKLAAADHIKPPSAATAPTGSTPAARESGSGATAPANGSSTDRVVGIVVLALAAIAGLIIVIGRVLGRRGLPHRWLKARQRLRLPLSRRALIPAIAVVLALVPITLLIVQQRSSAPSQATALAANPELD